jgi:hypothetical protein
MNVEFEQSRTGGDGPLGDIALAADYGVIGRHHRLEIVAVKIVESRAVLRDESFTDEGAEQQAGEGFLPVRAAEFHRLRSLEGHTVARPDLLDELPQQRWNAADVDQAEQRMIRGTRDREALGGSHLVGLMLPGVEQPIGGHRIPMPVKHL